MDGESDRNRGLETDACMHPREPRTHLRVVPREIVPHSQRLPRVEVAEGSHGRHVDGAVVVPVEFVGGWRPPDHVSHDVGHHTWLLVHTRKHTHAHAHARQKAYQWNKAGRRASRRGYASAGGRAQRRGRGSENMEVQRCCKSRPPHELHPAWQFRARWAWGVPSRTVCLARRLFCMCRSSGQSTCTLAPHDIMIHFAERIKTFRKPTGRGHTSS